ncbi:unnamed protein product [Fraxinus pennsylvanica]|uniref:Uncharacterized protein n=1 Tax=Fraxinus pennsylvanica TaxID=56036 RepID=A0AAD2E922_9LAMI|nr:unnamed protein product [Fraxinus pennsylvanica]
MNEKRKEKRCNGSSSIQDEAENVDEHPLVRHGRIHTSSGFVDTTTQNIEEVDVNPPSSPRQRDSLHHLQHNGSDFPSDEVTFFLDIYWGGISSEEHDETVMLKAAMFGGIPKRSGYHIPYAPHQLLQNGLDRPMDPYPRHMPRPAAHSLTAQRLIWEHQDDEADKEKELKAQEVPEAVLVEESIGNSSSDKYASVAQHVNTIIGTKLLVQLLALPITKKALRKPETHESISRENVELSS